MTATARQTQVPPWQLWIDTGGTFTDCLAVDPAGVLRRAKVLSSSGLRGRIVGQPDGCRIQVQRPWRVPADFFRGCRFRFLDVESADSSVRAYDSASSILELERRPETEVAADAAFEIVSEEEAPILATRLVTGVSPGMPLPPLRMRLATTRGTNALLERRGGRTVLFITRGFADLLRIRTQQRPDLFALDIHKPRPLYEAVVEVDERLAADGTVLRPLRLEALDRPARELVREGSDSAAVCLLHSYRNPDHEQRLASFLRGAGFRYVSCSAELAPVIQLLLRAETAVVDAYLASVITEYLQRVESSLEPGCLMVMTSAGGLSRAAAFRAKDSLLSGPAGGVVGAAVSARRSGYERILAFDMGGTSTDVARYAGEFEYIFEHQVGDAHLAAPSLAIESVAAGGGSICSFDGIQLKVGPESAGAVPGPACYGAGGPLTLTDVNLLLGRLEPERFEIPIDAGAAQRALERLLGEVRRSEAADASAETVLRGFLEIANERMADAIRRISVRQGYDPADYALLAFGGAGGQHATAVAELLGVKTVLVPQDAGLLSALGLGEALVERFTQRQVLRPLEEVKACLTKWLDELAEEAIAAVQEEGVPADQIEVRRRLLYLRFVGQDSTLEQEYGQASDVQPAFLQSFESLFGYRPEARPVELESLRVVASGRPAQTSPPAMPQPVPAIGEPSHRRRAFFRDAWTEVPVFQRAELKPGTAFDGPALVFERHSATVLDAGWSAEVDGASALLLRRIE